MTRKYQNQPETAFGENERWHPDGRVRAAMGMTRRQCKPEFVLIQACQTM